MITENKSLRTKKLAEKFYLVRKKSLEICAPLEIEDYTIQPSPEVSPPKWHLGHTTWFFEELILVPFLKNYKKFNEGFTFLFNSYYKTAGKHWIQAERGLLSRPTVKEVENYREYVDKHLIELLDVSTNDEVSFLVEAGLNHEEQHQELLYMDIKFILSRNLEPPNYATPKFSHAPVFESDWFKIEEGVYEIGHKGSDFCYDNEKPQHKAYVHPAAVCNKLVTNGEYLEFINSDGYKRSELWLSLGWDWLNENKIERPLYWRKYENKIDEFTLYGLSELDPHAPVTHISYFEADAFARWAKYRLPTEHEFEIFEKNYRPVANSSTTTDLLHPRFSDQKNGQVWCWTSSHYSPYPGFKAFKGTLGEYNGKFMCNQFVLKGGSIATPEGHYRYSYRNFYLAHQRWMFSGIRLAKDI